MNFDRLLYCTFHQLNTRMTVTYSKQVANGSFFCMFWKAMKIYRGSVYKIVWRDLIVFIVIFLTLQFTILYVFSESQQLAFKQMRDTFYIKREKIPMRYALGFFMLLVIGRWRFLHLSIPSADTFSLLVNSAMSSDSDHSKLLRRATVRYMVASYILNLRSISLRMRNRFPTFQSIVDLGILLKDEVEILQNIEERTLMTTYVIPLVWITTIINRARKEGLIDNDCIVQDLLTELGNYRRKLGDLLSYDLVCIPLFYIQVVTFSIYCYYFATIIGHQVCLEDDLPFMKIAISLTSASFNFVLHISCVKVSEVLINPFGEDDEDFEVDLMVDRNLKASYMIVDYMRVTENNYHSYSYPVFGETPKARQASSNDSDEESHLYCSLEENKETQTEDRYFQIYENVPVTAPPLQLRTPSQSMSHANNDSAIYDTIPIDKIMSSKSVARTIKEYHTYENVPKPSSSMQFQIPSQSSSYVDDVNVIYDTIRIDKINSSKLDAIKLEETHIYENVPKPSPPLRPQTLSQSSLYIDHVNFIIKSIPTDDVSFSESDVRTLEETHIYENVPKPSAPMGLQTPSQSMSHANNDSAIYDTIPIDKIMSSKSVARTIKEYHTYENVPKPSAPMGLQTPSQKMSYVDHVNVIIKNISTDDVSSSESDVRTLEETHIYENVPKPSAPMGFQTPSQTLSYVDNVNVIIKNIPTDDVSSSESDAIMPENSNLTISSESYARSLEETNVTPKPKKEPKKFSFAKFKFRRKNKHT